MTDQPIVPLSVVPPNDVLFWNERCHEWRDVDGVPVEDSAAVRLVPLPTQEQLRDALSGRSAVLDPEDAADVVLDLLKNLADGRHR